MNRSALVAGPCKMVFAGATLFSKDDVSVRLDQKTFDIRTAVHGKVDERVQDVSAELKFTPEGRWNAATIAALFPYANTACGTSIYTDVDRPCALHGSDATITTLKAAAVTQMPNMKFSSTETLVGSVGITGVRGNNLDWDDADSLLAIAGSGGSIADATFAPNLIKTQPYTLDFGTDLGGTPTYVFEDMDSEDGFTFETSLELADITVDRLGLVDKKLISVGCMVKVKPVGPSAAAILAALKIQDTGAARGRSLGSNELRITGADGITYLTIPSCDVKTAGFRFGTTVLRNDELGFVAGRTFTSGAQNALFTLAAS